MGSAYVVTGGGRGIGRAVVERLLADGHTVVAIEVDPEALAWLAEHPAASRARAVTGSAADEAVTERAADLAEAAGGLQAGSTTRPSSATPLSSRPRRGRSWS